MQSEHGADEQRLLRQEALRLAGGATHTMDEVYVAERNARVVYCNVSCSLEIELAAPASSEELAMIDTLAWTDTSQALSRGVFVWAVVDVRVKGCGDLAIGDEYRACRGDRVVSFEDLMVVQRGGQMVVCRLVPLSAMLRVRILRHATCKHEVLLLLPVCFQRLTALGLLVIDIFADVLINMRRRTCGNTLTGESSDIRSERLSVFKSWTAWDFTDTESVMKITFDNSGFAVASQVSWDRVIIWDTTVRTPQVNTSSKWNNSSAPASSDFVTGTFHEKARMRQSPAFDDRALDALSSERIDSLQRPAAFIKGQCTVPPQDTLVKGQKTVLAAKGGVQDDVPAAADTTTLNSDSLRRRGLRIVSLHAQVEGNWSPELAAVTGGGAHRTPRPEPCHQPRAVVLNTELAAVQASISEPETQSFAIVAPHSPAVVPVRPMSSQKKDRVFSRQRRRIIGAVDRSAEISSFGSGRTDESLICPAVASTCTSGSTSVFRMDVHDGASAGMNRTGARESSLTRCYESLGVEFHRIDDEEDVPPSEHQASVPMQRIELPPLRRLRSFGCSSGPGSGSSTRWRHRTSIKEASAMALDMGEAQPPMAKLQCGGRPGNRLLTPTRQRAAGEVLGSFASPPAAKPTMQPALTGLPAIHSKTAAAPRLRPLVHAHSRCGSVAWSIDGCRSRWGCNGIAL